jgi:hypothetical protein
VHVAMSGEMSVRTDAEGSLGRMQKSLSPVRWISTTRISVTSASGGAWAGKDERKSSTTSAAPSTSMTTPEEVLAIRPARWRSVARRYT